MHAMKFTKLSALSALLSLAIAACCDAHAAVRKGENILVNGTFESDQAQCPPGWANYDRVRVKPTPAGGPEGHPFLRFSSETPPPEESSVRQYGIHLAPEGRYRFTVFVRARDFKYKSGGIALIRSGRKFDAGNLPHDTGGKWVRLSNTFKSFPGEGAYACVLYVAGWTGELDIADIRLVPGVEFFDFFEAVAKATGEELYLEKARAMADCIVRNQRKDGTIPTYFDSRGGSDWVNCMASSADSLMAFAEALKSAGKATAGR